MKLKSIISYFKKPKKSVEVPTPVVELLPDVPGRFTHRGHVIEAFCKRIGITVPYFVKSDNDVYTIGAGLVLSSEIWLLRMHDDGARVETEFESWLTTNPEPIRPVMPIPMIYGMPHKQCRTIPAYNSIVRGIVKYPAKHSVWTRAAKRELLAIVKKNPWETSP